MHRERSESFGFLERETITATLRTRVFHLDEPMVVIDGEGEKHRICSGATLLVVDRVDPEQPVAEQYLDATESLLHYLWRPGHAYPETRTPFDIRTAEAGGRETPAIPF